MKNNTPFMGIGYSFVLTVFFWEIATHLWFEVFIPGGGCDTDTIQLYGDYSLLNRSVNLTE